MAKCDLKSAYRSAEVSKHSQKVIGFKCIYHRQAPPFRSKLVPGIFHRLTQAVKRMLNRRGLKATVIYLDEFFIKAVTLNEFSVALQILVQIVRKLGFNINWNKVVDPTTNLLS